MVKALARLYHQLGQADDAREALHSQLHTYSEAVDLTHVNILAELYMEASDWKLAVDLIQYAKHALCAQAELPVELQASRCCLEQHVDGALQEAYYHKRVICNRERTWHIRLTCMVLMLSVLHMTVVRGIAVVRLKLATQLVEYGLSLHSLPVCSTAGCISP